MFQKFGRSDRTIENNDTLNYASIDLFSELFARGIISAYKAAVREGSFRFNTVFHFTKIISRLSNSNESVKRLLVEELGVFDALHHCLQMCLHYRQRQHPYQKLQKDIIYSIVTSSASSVTFLTNHVSYVECAIEYECVLDLLLCLENFEIDLKINLKIEGNDTSSSLSPSPSAIQGCIIGCFRALKALSNYPICVEYIQSIDNAEMILCNAANRLHEIIEYGRLIKKHEAEAIVQMMDELLGVTNDANPAMGVIEEIAETQSSNSKNNKVDIMDNNTNVDVVSQNFASSCVIS